MAAILNTSFLPRTIVLGGTLRYLAITYIKLHAVYNPSL